MLRFFIVYQSLFYFSFCAMANGYVTSRLMKYFGSSEWRFAAYTSSVCLVTYIITIFLLVDVIEYFEMSD